MTHLLNLFAAIALLVWGTHLVRTGILRVFGANLRSILAHSTGNRFAAVVSGIGVTAVVHCAGAVRGASRADFDRINVDGTARLVQAAAATVAFSFEFQ